MKSKDLKIGLSIRGGAMRSVAYAGAIKALEEHNIKIDYIVGASGGSVVASFYALGKTPDEIFDYFFNFKPLDFLGIRYLIHKKIFSYDKWVEYAANAIDNANIEDANIQLFIQATNLSKERLEYLDKGNVAKAVVASSAAFGAYKYKRSWYLDGEYDPEFAADFLKEKGADIVIGLQIIELNFNFLDHFIKPLRIVQDRALELDKTLHPLDVYIPINVRSYGMTSRANLHKMYKKGYHEVNKNIDSIKKTLHSKRQTEDQKLKETQ